MKTSIFFYKVVTAVLVRKRVNQLKLDERKNMYNIYSFRRFPNSVSIQHINSTFFTSFYQIVLTIINVIRVATPER